MSVKTLLLFFFFYLESRDFHTINEFDLELPSASFLASLDNRTTATKKALVIGSTAGRDKSFFGFEAFFLLDPHWGLPCSAVLFPDG